MTEPAATPEEMQAANAVAPDVGLPGRLDVRRAFDIYVFGRSRALGPTEKAIAIGGTTARPFSEPAVTGSPPAPPVRAPDVRVPDALRFDRSAGTWRAGRGSSKEGARSA